MPTTLEVGDSGPRSPTGSSEEDRSLQNHALETIAACVVNHNTSPFAELALRSLVATHSDPGSPAVLEITVLDNHSEDEGIGALETAAHELGVEFQRTRWPLRSAQVNTHGDVLRDFVLAHPDADHLLFVDADVVFDTAGSVWTMLREAAESPEVWAVQARFRWMEEHNGPGSSIDIGAGRELTVWVGTSRQQDHDYPIAGTLHRRCHPGCTLVVNSDAFRRVADVVGLSCAVVASGDSDLGGFFDTFGLASHVMATHGLHYLLSEAAVVHYFNVSYDPHPEKLSDCRRRLDGFRNHPGRPVAPGPFG